MRHWGKSLVSVLALACVIASAETRDVACPSASCARGKDLLVKAFVTTAGPYGELWEVELRPGNEMHVSISYLLKPMGDLKGTFLIDPSLVDTMVKVVETQQFFALPNEISANDVAIHAPDLRLTITRGDTVREVRLYDPAAISQRSETKRFLAVWTAVFAPLPIRPSW
jgi:hypothetical protein